VLLEGIVPPPLVGAGAGAPPPLVGAGAGAGPD